MARMPWSLSSLYRVQALAIEAKHAPPFVRHLETPNRVCVCFYGPSVTQVGTACSRVLARGCLHFSAGSARDYLYCGLPQARLRDYSWVTAAEVVPWDDDKCQQVSTSRSMAPQATSAQPGTAAVLQEQPTPRPEDAEAYHYAVEEVIVAAGKGSAELCACTDCQQLRQRQRLGHQRC